MSWHVAPSLLTLRDEIDYGYPERARHIDGFVGDAAHAARRSAHNPDEDGTVRAGDFTAITPDGRPVQGMAEAILEACEGHPAALLMIHQGKIWSRNHGPWRERPYTGANPHRDYVHVSTLNDVEGTFSRQTLRQAAEDTTPWGIVPGMGDVRYLYGYRVCDCVVDSMMMLEWRLRKAGLIARDLSGLITQGAYNRGGVAASVGTHDGGGVLDVPPILVNTAAKRRIWRDSGVAMWYRRASEGPWRDHGHGVWDGCPHLSAGAKRQITAYRQGRNGLANNRADQGPKPATYRSWQAAHSAFLDSLTPVERLLLTMDETKLRAIIADEAGKATATALGRMSFPTPRDIWNVIYRRFWGGGADTTVAKAVFEVDRAVHNDLPDRLTRVEDGLASLNTSLDRLLALLGDDGK